MEELSHSFARDTSWRCDNCWDRDKISLAQLWPIQKVTFKDGALWILSLRRKRNPPGREVALVL